jgi:hypothetical protein
MPRDHKYQPSGIFDGVSVSDSEPKSEIGEWLEVDWDTEDWWDPIPRKFSSEKYSGILVRDLKRGEH